MPTEMVSLRPKTGRRPYPQIVELNDLLNAIDAAGANVDKLDGVWKRVEPMIPNGAIWNANTPEFDDLERHWVELRDSLPPLDGWTIKADLPDPEGIGQSFIEYMEFGEPPFSVYQEIEKPAREIAEYRWRLNKARKQAIRRRLDALIATIDEALPQMLKGVPRTSLDEIHGPLAEAVRGAVQELDRLLGDTLVRVGRWGDLYRHLSFSQGHD